MEKRLAERRFRRSTFDRFAETASRFAGRGAFFTGCVTILVLWLVSYPVVGSADTWQLVINTVTTIMTFLLVALLQNSQRRTEFVLQTKLNALADALADLMEHQATGDAGDLNGGDGRPAGRRRPRGADLTRGGRGVAEPPPQAAAGAAAGPPGQPRLTLELFGGRGKA
jgi:hypothetical protein